jgi:phosphoribosyl 1,2-cyclic phosphodiesterase
VQLTVLGSGSRGNASLLAWRGHGWLIDIGLGPRQLAKRLLARGRSWREVRGVLLTHTHSDHWNERTLAYLVRLQIPLYCHAEHAENLRSWSSAVARLELAGLVRQYDETPLELPGALHCRPLKLRHDSGATFGFRFDAPGDLLEPASSLAYLADLGSWDAALAEAIADVQMLALEFNHDVAMQWSSGRSPSLIERVLSDDGHLSNDQASALVDQMLGVAGTDRLQHLVQLHLSRDCNRPELAVAAARQVFERRACDCRVQTASQDEPAEPVALNAGVQPAAREA